MPYKDLDIRRKYHTEYMRKYRHDNRVTYNAYSKEYRISNADKTKSYEKAYRERNHEAYTKRQRERWHNNNGAAKRTAWLRRNPTKNRQYMIARKARIRNADMGDVDLAKLVVEWDRKCGICKKFVYDKFDVDHIIPLARGGLHTQSNLQLTHSSCNSSKGTKIL